MESFVLENNGVVVETKPGLGRVMTASRDFEELFERVIREKPALTWLESMNTLSSMAEYLEAYSNSPDIVQQGILQLCHPPIDGLRESNVVSTAGSAAAHLVSKYPAFTESFIKKLLAIAFTNAHEYYGVPQQSNSSEGGLTRHEYIQGTGTAQDKATAIFLFGSMPQHSCTPNVTYTSRTHDGALEYRAIQRIKKGDPICFSYIGDLFQSPTYERRARLQEHKDFFCKCSRCIAADYTRIANCPSCGEKCACAPVDDLSKKWVCSSCHSIGDETTNIERRLEGELVNAQRHLRAESATAILYRIRNDAIANLSPTHFLAIRAWKELARLYASKAVEIAQYDAYGSRLPPFLLMQRGTVSEGLNLMQLRQKAAVCGLRAISLSECVANECEGCKPGSLKHDPVHGLGADMFHACTDLMEVRNEMRPPYAAAMVERYIPIMYQHFGQDDADVREIAEKVVGRLSNRNNAKMVCEGCGKVESGKMMNCARCALVHYCSKNCQLSDWKKKHKTQCVPKYC